MRGIVRIRTFVSRSTDVDLEIVVLVTKCQGRIDVDMDVDVESRRIFLTVKSFLEWLTRVSSPRLSRRPFVQLAWTWTRQLDALALGGSIVAELAGDRSRSGCSFQPPADANRS